MIIFSGKDSTFEKMEQVREQQEKLARLHFELNAQQEIYGYIYLLIFLFKNFLIFLSSGNIAVLILTRIFLNYI